MNRTKASCCTVNRSKVFQYIPLGFSPGQLRQPSSQPGLSRNLFTRRAIQLIIAGFPLARIGQEVDTFAAGNRVIDDD